MSNEMSVIASKMCHKCALMLGLAAPSETAHFALQSLALICHMFGTYQILAAEPEIAIDKSLTFPSTVHFHYNSSVFKMLLNLLIKLMHFLLSRQGQE